MHRTLYHIDHPEYGRPITRAEEHVDFTGRHRGVSILGAQAWERDVNACADEFMARERRTTGPLLSFNTRWRQSVWACVWRKGWRWDTDAPPTAP
jgi:hypothetical protein